MTTLENRPAVDVDSREHQAGTAELHEVPGECRDTCAEKAR